jgi:hypothetical protein
MTGYYLSARRGVHLMLGVDTFPFVIICVLFLSWLEHS